MQKFIIGNWKENPESLEIAKKLLQITDSFNEKLTAKNIFVTHAVPNIFVGFLSQEKQKIILQNISCFEGGSHTGEIGALQAKNLGITMSIVGHSETRLSPNNSHGDEDAQVNLKIKNLFEENMWAVLCIGEYEREKTDYKIYLQNQIELDLKDITPEKLNNLCIAYEPVWAIGKNAVRVATDTEITETVLFIKKYLAEKYGEIGGNIKVLYGGSVDENNAKEILNLQGVDGLLIGRASSDPEKWKKLLENLL